MYKYRMNAKTDANQKEIVDALRKIPGVTVKTGVDDILVGVAGKNYLYEIKNRDGRDRKQKSQIQLEETWTGHYRVVHDLNEIIEDIWNKTRPLGAAGG